MKLSRRHLTAVGTLALGAPTLIRSAHAQSADEATVKKAVEELRMAWLKQDKAKIESLTAEQLSYSHSDARLEDKTKFMLSTSQSLIQYYAIGNCLKTLEAGFTTVRSMGWYPEYDDVALKRAIETMVISRLNMIKSMKTRLMSGIFDPEADLRDFEDYLRNSIGRQEQDKIATMNRICSNRTGTKSGTRSSKIFMR